MSFLAPLAFWTAAIVVPALLVLYFLKLRRRQETVPSTLLWKRAVQDLQVNAPFQRLRKNLLLFLQLLVLLAGVFALARPIVQSEVSDERSVILLLDRSASMNAQEGHETRLEQAKEQAARLLGTFNRTGSGWFSFGGAEARTRVMAISFADRASVISPFTTNMSELADLVRRVEPTDARTNMREALELAEAYMMPARGNVLSIEGTPISAETASKLVLISDGGVADLGELVLRSGTMELIKIGQTRDNVGITAFRFQRNFLQPQVVDVFLQIRNFGAEPVETDVSLYVEGQLQAVQSTSLGAPQRPTTPSEQPAGESVAADAAPGGASASVSFQLVLEKAAVIEARLSRDDGLRADNKALGVVPPPRKLRVLLVSSGNFFLESVLKGLPLEELKYLTPEQYEGAPPGALESAGRSLFDVVVFDKHQTGRLPAGSYYFLGAAPQVDFIKVTGTLESHAMMWWDESHPVLRHVALDFVLAGKGLTIEAPPAARVLAEGPRGPVLAHVVEGGRQFLIQTFPVESSNLWSKPSFPVLMYNALRFLGGGGNEDDREPLRPGDSVRITVAPGTGSISVRRPDGRVERVSADAGGIARFAGTEQVGLYVAEGAVQGGAEFAVNLEDARESDIAPAAQLAIGGNQAVRELAAIQSATPEIWRWFIGGAMLIALIEWWVYNRRVML